MTNVRIRRDPKVMAGKPCVAGTRITVEAILEDLSDGMTVQQVVEAYPALTDADVSAALDYAAEYLRQESLIAAE